MKYLLSLFLLILFSCSNSSSGIEEPDNSIKLSSYKVILLAGEKGTIKLLDFSHNRDYGMIVDNPDIAFADWINDGNSIEISAECTGTTNIRIMDNKDLERTALINVTCPYFSGVFIEKGNLAQIHVASHDETILKSITDELKEKANNRSELIYNFDSKSKSVTIDFSKTPGKGILYKGTYEWSKNSLILNYNNISEKYFFMIDNGAYYIIEDCSDYYKSKYSDKKIEFVRLWYRLLGTAVK